MATWWIDPTSGNDSSDGSTKALAKKTFANVDGLMGAGDTLTIVDGTHTLTANQTFTSAVNNITIESEGGDPRTCIIDGDSNTYYLKITLGTGTQTVQNIQFANFVEPASSGQVILFTGNTNLTILNCWFVSFTGAGKSVNTAIGVIYGGNSSGCTVYVTSCCFLNIQWPACIHNRDGTNDLYITNCVFAQTTNNVMRCVGGVYMTFWQVKAITNTIFYANTTVNCSVTKDSLGTTTIDLFTHSCYHNAGAGSWTFDTAPTSTVSSITTDPLLVDPASLQFELQKDSPCIDTGTA